MSDTPSNEELIKDIREYTVTQATIIADQQSIIVNYVTELKEQYEEIERLKEILRDIRNESEIATYIWTMASEALNPTKKVE